MTRAMYSRIFETSVDELWSVVREFGDYSLWVAGAGTHTMEPGRSSDSVGAARIIDLSDRRIVRRLVEFSDSNHFYRYSFEKGAPPEITEYEGCVSMQPITETGGTFVSWSAVFETSADRREEWQRTFAEWFSGWLAHLHDKVTPTAPSSTGVGGGSIPDSAP